MPAEVFVMNSDQEAPSFSEGLHSFFISEDSKVSTTIATVVARSNDSIEYSIISGQTANFNSLGTFEINAETGTLTLTGSLDRERIELYELTVVVETLASPSLIAYTQVSIEIMDVNDNSPAFESHDYYVKVSEDVTIGSNIIQVVANDKDANTNGKITYSFAKEYRSVANIFAIDSKTGWISTLVELDRESIDNYTFHVLAKDHGTEELSDICVVTLTVEDRNDCPPVFTRDVYEATVNEDALPGTVVLTVTTTDNDLEEHAQKSFFITDGDSLGNFNVNHEGGVYVYKSLDCENIAFYDLEITATDGVFITTSRLHISILDANDNAPECAQVIIAQV